MRGRLRVQPHARLHVLKRVRFFSALFLLLLALPAVAQQRFEGTLTQTLNGQGATARIYAQSPDLLRVEVARNDAANVPAQIIVASGDQTLRYEPATKRLFRARFNVLKNWNRDWRLAAGGPANFVFAGANAGTIAEREGRYLRRDSVLFGGGGENAFYAARKTPAGLYPARVELSGNPVNKRVETAVDGTQSLNANLTYAGALPARLVVVAAGETSTFTYDLSARAEPFEAATWTLAEAKSAVAEEIDLRAPSAYADANDPNDLLNQGVALWRGAGDFIGAQGRFVAAANIAREATAPRLATFEMALDARDFPAAQGALEALAPLGLDVAELEARRARLALATRDWDGALSALDKAIAAAPDSAALRLGRAQALLGRGDVEGARAVWQAVASGEAPAATRATAATLWAQSFVGGATDGQPVPLQEGMTLAWTLARLQRGDNTPVPPPLQINGQSPEQKMAALLSSDAARVALALANERAARDDEARKLWTQLEQSAPDPIKNQARAHLMVLAARDGDTAASLAAYARLRDGLSLQSERENATVALFDAWQKAFRRDQLGAAIANRAVATRATDADARLALAYQESYGDDAAIEAAVTSGLGRSPDGAFWLARRAEVTAQTAFPLLTSNAASAGRRAQLLDRARADLERAIVADEKAGGDGGFYRQQLALVSAQSAAKVTRSPDLRVALGERETAKAAVEKLLASAPDDPDVLVSAALALQSFDGDDGARRAIALATRALDSDPNDGARHTLILAARQAMAFAHVRLKQFPQAAAQFELLLLEAQTAGEQFGIAANYLGMLEKTGDADGNVTAGARAAASLVARVAQAPWEYDEARGALEALARRVAISPFLTPIETILAADGGAAATLGWAHIARARLAGAGAALQVPGAPGSADAELERATRDSQNAVAALQAAQSAPMPRWVEARVAAWLAEFGGLPTEAALASLRRAVAIESRAPALRLALAQALPDEAEASEQLKLAAQLAPATPENARVLSIEALGAGEVDAALQRSAAAYHESARDPNASASAFQRIAFARARVLWEAERTTDAVGIYENLALPQWADIDRAAALLALRARYTASGRAAEAERLGERIRELGLELPTLQRAAAFVEEVEG